MQQELEISRRRTCIPGGSWALQKLQKLQENYRIASMTDCMEKDKQVLCESD